MKKIISMIILSLFFVSVNAEYNPDKEYNSDWVNTKMITTTSIKTMHPSWDLNFDGINDCESDWTCDDSIDYTSAKTYFDKDNFLEAEGQICKAATDGCNTIGVNNWNFTFATEMYCEDTYWENGSEEFSCKSYDSEKLELTKFIKENISDITDEKAVLGWTWYVSEIEFKADNEVLIKYSDGHIMWETSMSVSDIKNIQTWLNNDNRICTMQYDPVCGEQQVQCIKAPCYPIKKTYWNACMANFDYLYTWECSGFVDNILYKKFQKYTIKYTNVLEKFDDEKLEKIIVIIDKRIQATKNSKIAKQVQVERITAYTFLKEIAKNILMK